MEFDPGFAIHMEEETLTFSYGDGAFGPICEKRHLIFVLHWRMQMRMDRMFYTV